MFLVHTCTTFLDIYLGDKSLSEVLCSAILPTVKLFSKSILPNYNSNSNQQQQIRVPIDLHLCQYLVMSTFLNFSKSSECVSVCHCGFVNAIFMKFLLFLFYTFRSCLEVPSSLLSSLILPFLVWNF